MNAANPCESAAVQSREDAYASVPRDPRNWVLTGCLIGAAVPIAFGAYLFYRDSLYFASLPPGTGSCGLMELGAFIVKVIIIVAGAPICGLIGSLVGWVASKVSV